MEEKDLEGVVINEFESDVEMANKLTPEDIEPYQLFLTKSANNAATNIGLPIGAIFPSAVPIVDARVHILDGSVISQTGAYQDFTILIKALVAAGNNIAYTNNSDYENDLNKTGSCGKFVIDDVAGTIRLPRITTFIQGVENIQGVGQAISAGVPNIIGKWWSGWNVPGRGFHGLETLGAFYDSYDNGAGYNGEGRIQGTDSNNSSTRGYPWFEASRGELKSSGLLVNDVYGKSDTVQPNAVRYPYYIVLANGYKSTKVVNTDYIMNELNAIANELAEYKASLATKITFDQMYPIGSIFITLNKEQSPARIKGTWELLPEGKALWTASSGAGNTIGAGLPNITGSFQFTDNDNGSDWYVRARYADGAFYTSGSGEHYMVNSNGNTKGTGPYAIGFKASRSSSIYGGSSTVQPPAYKIYAYKRIG